ncbi:MAG: site-2 protease family protein [Clostridia bacterium]|nr:site-2 protease family protein [Clostridia bacterium]
MLSGGFSEWVQDLLYFLPALLIGLSVHEFAHAYVAYKLGDKSQKALGRLTLSPLAHVDPIGFIFMLIFKFGWGRPVSVDDRNFKKRGKGVMLVSLAGPLSNIIVAFAFTILLKILDLVGVYTTLAVTNLGEILLIILSQIISFNIVLAVFNLIPIAPFDGYKVLYYFLPYKAKKFMDKIEPYSIYILILLMLTDLYALIIMPAYSLIALLLNLILMI